jgi:PAS domain S-box-containing protein
MEYFSIRFPIDEQKKRELEMIAAKKEIENEKKKHEAILEGNVDGVISFNEAGIIQYINKAGEEIIAASRTSLLGTDIKEIIPIVIDNIGTRHEVFFVHKGEKKKIGLRTEVFFDNKVGSAIDILASITGSDLEDGHLFTLFAQNVTVDLF